MLIQFFCREWVSEWVSEWEYSDISGVYVQSECANSNLKLFSSLRFGSIARWFFQVQGRRMYYDIIECKMACEESSGKSKMYHHRTTHRRIFKHSVYNSGCILSLSIHPVVEHKTAKSLCTKHSTAASGSRDRRSVDSLSLPLIIYFYTSHYIFSFLCTKNHQNLVT